MTSSLALDYHFFLQILHSRTQSDKNEVAKLRYADFQPIKLLFLPLCWQEQSSKTDVDAAKWYLFSLYLFTLYLFPCVVKFLSFFLA